jgi:hypothetical protein
VIDAAELDVKSISRSHLGWLKLRCGVGREVASAIIYIGGPVRQADGRPAHSLGTNTRQILIKVHVELVDEKAKFT